MVDLSGVFGAAFSSIYDDAVLVRPASLTDDGSGSIVRGAPIEFLCKAQVDSATEAMRRGDGYAETDQRVLVLSASVAIEPSTDDEIWIRDRAWAIANVSRDPARTYYDMRVRPSSRPVHKHLAGLLAGASALSGSLVAKARLTGTMAGSATLSNSGLSVRARLAGTIVGHSTIAANLRTRARFVGSIAAVSSFSGSLFVGVPAPPAGQVILTDDDGEPLYIGDQYLTEAA